MTVGPSSDGLLGDYLHNNPNAYWCPCCWAFTLERIIPDSQLCRDPRGRETHYRTRFVTDGERTKGRGMPDCFKDLVQIIHPLLIASKARSWS
jgi:hypothetical protein